MANRFYDIDINRIVRWNIPVKKRRPKILARLYSLVFGLTAVYNSLLQFRTAKLYQLMITPQVCYLERMLNDKYDYTQRRIRIGDPVYNETVFLFLETELKPLYILTTGEEGVTHYMYTESESGLLKDDFVINVPLDIIFFENEMRALTDTYRLAGKKYKIERV